MRQPFEFSTISKFKKEKFPGKLFAEIWSVIMISKPARNGQILKLYFLVKLNFVPTNFEDVPTSQLLSVLSDVQEIMIDS